MVILRSPAEQLLQTVVDNGGGIEYFEDRLQPGRRHLGRVRNRGNESDPALSPEGDADTRPDGGPGRPLHRGQIVEQPAQGGVERHPENLGHLGVRMS